MDLVWLGLLGLLLAGWSVLDGGNLGLGRSLRRIGRTGPERRLLLTAIGPFLLGGEVWLVAAAGLLIGAFPALEKDLLYAYYPLVVTLVVAWVLRDIGVWFRSRRPSAAWQRGGNASSWSRAPCSRSPGARCWATWRRGCPRPDDRVLRHWSGLIHCCGGPPWSPC